MIWVNKASLGILAITASIAMSQGPAFATSVATDTPTAIGNALCASGTTMALSRAANPVEKGAALGAAMARATATPPDCALSQAAILQALNDLKTQFPGSASQIQAAFDSAAGAGAGSGDGADKSSEELLPTGDVGEPVESSKK